MNRRDFLFSAAAGASAVALSRFSFADATQPAPQPIAAHLTLLPNQPGAAIDREFLGLSYESAQLAHPDYFSATNHELVGFLRNLAPRGVLRIGGNTSEYAFWTPKPAAQQQPNASPDSSDIVGPDKGHKPAPPTQTTPQAIRNLRGFLDATGWRAYYGLNLGKGTPQQAADEAAFVADTLGDRLILFQIGNEADLYHNNGLRPANYDYAAFARDWQRFYDAVHARVPKAKFGGPDTAVTGVWVDQFAKQFHNQVELLSSHYYAEGPPTNPAMTIEHLLAPTNDRWDKGVPDIRAAMAASQLPFRLAETNSCYQGGKQGVSNTFASALWATDLMLDLASFGANGINFHGGGYGWYAPIVGTIPNGFVARPEYYGLLLFAQLLGGRMLASDLHVPNSSPLLKAHAVRGANGSHRAIILNKDAQQNYRLTVQAPAAAERVAIQRLLAPSLDDTTDVTFAAAPVGDSGAWHPERFESVPVRNGGAVC
ncbi:MAG TPA: glycosyl hydrolase family 79 C-terminal domain-containing protein, partial [Acidobacteriaceae bacterium]|nr:glycosyl hydrolase family 79 C-terminal domain-containing protein [Acidobacteriaceae bacterium]